MNVAEKSAAQAKENLETMTAAAGEATNLLKHNYATAVKGTQDYGTKVLEFTNANISAADIRVSPQERSRTRRTLRSYHPI